MAAGSPARDATAPGPLVGPDGWVAPPSGDHAGRPTLGRSSLRARPAIGSGLRVLARSAAMRAALADVHRRGGGGSGLTAGGRQTLAPVAGALTADGGGVAAEFMSDGGLGQAACPERINLASFGSGQGVGRDGLTVAGWSCRDWGGHRAPWHRPRRATGPVRTGRTGSAASVVLPSGTGLKRHRKFLNVGSFLNPPQYGCRKTFREETADALVKTGSSPHASDPDANSR